MKQTPQNRALYASYLKKSLKAINLLLLLQNCLSQTLIQSGVLQQVTLRNAVPRCFQLLIKDTDTQVSVLKGAFTQYSALYASFISQSPNQEKNQFFIDYQRNQGFQLTQDRLHSFCTFSDSKKTCSLYICVYGPAGSQLSFMAVQNSFEIRLNQGDVLELPYIKKQDQFAKIQILGSSDDILDVEFTFNSQSIDQMKVYNKLYSKAQIDKEGIEKSWPTAKKYDLKNKKSDNLVFYSQGDTKQLSDPQLLLTLLPSEKVQNPTHIDYDFSQKLVISVGNQLQKVVIGQSKDSYLNKDQWQFYQLDILEDNQNLVVQYSDNTGSPKSQQSKQLGYVIKVNDKKMTYPTEQEYLTKGSIDMPFIQVYNDLTERVVKQRVKGSYIIGIKGVKSGEYTFSSKLVEHPIQDFEFEDRLQDLRVEKDQISYAFVHYQSNESFLDVLVANEQTNLLISINSVTQNEIDADGPWKYLPTSQQAHWQFSYSKTKGSQRFRLQDSDTNFCKNCVYLIGFKALDDTSLIKLRFPKQWDHNSSFKLPNNDIIMENLPGAKNYSQIYSFYLTHKDIQFPKFFLNIFQGNVTVLLSSPQPQFTYEQALQTSGQSIIDLNKVLKPSEGEQSIISQSNKDQSLKLERRILVRCLEKEECRYEIGILKEKAEMELKVSSENDIILDQSGTVHVKIESDGDQGMIQVHTDPSLVSDINQKDSSFLRPDLSFGNSKSSFSLGLIKYEGSYFFQNLPGTFEMQLQNTQENKEVRSLIKADFTSQLMINSGDNNVQSLKSSNPMTLKVNLEDGKIDDNNTPRLYKVFVSDCIGSHQLHFKLGSSPDAKIIDFNQLKKQEISLESQDQDLFIIAKQRPYMTDLTKKEYFKDRSLLKVQLLATGLQSDQIARFDWVYKNSPEVVTVEDKDKSHLLFVKVDKVPDREEQFWTVKTDYYALLSQDEGDKDRYLQCGQMINALGIEDQAFVQINGKKVQKSMFVARHQFEERGDDFGFFVDKSQFLGFKFLAVFVQLTQTDKANLFKRSEYNFNYKLLKISPAVINPDDSPTQKDDTIEIVFVVSMVALCVIILSIIIFFLCKLKKNFTKTESNKRSNDMANKKRLLGDPYGDNSTVTSFNPSLLTSNSNNSQNSMLDSFSNINKQHQSDSKGSSKERQQYYKKLQNSVKN